MIKIFSDNRPCRLHEEDSPQMEPRGQGQHPEASRGYPATIGQAPRGRAQRKFPKLFPVYRYRYVFPSRNIYIRPQYRFDKESEKRFPGTITSRRSFLRNLCIPSILSCPGLHLRAVVAHYPGYLDESCRFLECIRAAQHFLFTS